MDSLGDGRIYESGFIHVIHVLKKKCVALCRKSNKTSDLTVSERRPKDDSKAVTFIAHNSVTATERYEDNVPANRQK